MRRQRFCFSRTKKEKKNRKEDSLSVPYAVCSAAGRYGPGLPVSWRTRWARPGMPVVCLFLFFFVKKKRRENEMQ